MPLNSSDSKQIYGSNLSEYANFGNNDNDFVLVTVLDDDGDIIETATKSVNEFKTGELFTFNPGRVLRSLGYVAGKYRVKLNFLRRRAGERRTVFLNSDREIYEGDTHQGSDGRMYTGANPQASNIRLLSEDVLGYDVTKISPSKKEIKLTLKDLDPDGLTNYSSSFNAFDTPVYTYIPNSSDGNADEGTITVDSSDPYKLKATVQDSDIGFSEGMVGGTLTIDNAFVTSYTTQTRGVATNTNTVNTQTNVTTDIKPESDNIKEDDVLNPLANTNEQEENTGGGTPIQQQQADEEYF